MSSNFKTVVADGLAALLALVKGEDPKDQAVRRLGVANAIASKGESEKKAAKAALQKLQIVPASFEAGAETVIYDSVKYRLTAKTNEASQRVDPSLIHGALAAEKIPQSKINSILAAITVDATPATKLIVEQKA